LATDYIDDLSPFFKRLELVRLPGVASHKTGNARHDANWQMARRSHIALSRNRLLSAALSLVADHNVNWVLWLDSDIRHIPRDLIRHLLSANQSIVVPNCLWKQGNGQVRHNCDVLNGGASVTRVVCLVSFYLRQGGYIVLGVCSVCLSVSVCCTLSPVALYTLYTRCFEERVAI